MPYGVLVLGSFSWTVLSRNSYIHLCFYDRLQSLGETVFIIEEMKYWKTFDFLFRSVGY